MKLTGMILCMTAGTAFGIYMAEGLSVRIREIEKCISLITFFITHMKFSLSSPSDMIMRCSVNAKWITNIKTLLRSGVDFPYAFEKAAGNSTLKKEERELMTSFFRDFGRTDVNGEESRLLLLKTRMETLLISAKEEKAQKSKLFVMLGVSAGAVISLLAV